MTSTPTRTRWRGSSPNSLPGPYAMVIGAYTTVDFDLRELPPGLIDHREWTRDNGRNNALRINGLGAPRAFDVSVLRRVGLPNVSYGEDYAVALRLSREYEIGRIYESLYLCRRWSGNTDSALPLADDAALRHLQGPPAHGGNPGATAAQCQRGRLHGVAEAPHR